MLFGLGPSRRDSLAPTADGVPEMQAGGHDQHIENERLERPVDDETSGSAEFSGIGGGACYDSAMKLVFLNLQQLDL